MSLQSRAARRGVASERRELHTAIETGEPPLQERHEIIVEIAEASGQHNEPRIDDRQHMAQAAGADRRQLIGRRIDLVQDLSGKRLPSVITSVSL